MTSFKDVFIRNEMPNLLEDDLKESLFYLSLPIVIINLLRTTYNIIDTFWLGQLSKEALAAITFAFPLVFLLISMAMGIAIAGSILVAQNEGSKNKSRRNFAASQTVTFSLISSVILGVIGYFHIEKLVVLLGASESVVPLAAGYLRVISLGLFFMFGFSVFISLMRGYGDTVTPMGIMFVSIVINVILDPFMIFGWWIFPRLGVEGAAIATVFSRGLAMMVGMGILFTGRKGIRIRLGEMVPDLGFFKKIVKVGFPASIETVARATTVNMLVAVVGMFPTAVVAGYGVGVRIFSFVFMPAEAIARGVSTMTGQNIGGDRFDRAGKVNFMAAKFMFAVFSIFGVLVFIFSEGAVSIFTNEAEVIKVGSEFLKITALSFGFIGIMRSFTGGFRGSGKTLNAAVISLMTLGVIRLPIAFFMSGVLGAMGIWVAFPISNVAGAVIAYFWFRAGTWRHKIVD